MENTGDQWPDPGRPIGEPAPPASPWANPGAQPPAGPGAQPPAGPGAQPPAGPGAQPPAAPWGSPGAQPPAGPGAPPPAGQPWPSPPPGQPWGHPAGTQLPGNQLPGTQPAPPRKKTAKWVVALVLCVGLLAVACLGTVAFGVVKAVQDTDTTASGARPYTGFESTPETSTAPTTKPPARPVGVTGSVPKGSKASSYAVKKPEDLERVCDRWYYPKSPKYTTSVSPHPIAVSVRERKDMDFRSTKSYLGIPYDAPAPIKEAWEGRDATKVQLVACVDLVTIGDKVSSCKVDKPKPTSIVMKEGTYRVSVYEVATRRKIFESKLVGEKEDCPIFILIGNDRAVYTTPEDRQLVDVLKRFVEE